MTAVVIAYCYCNGQRLLQAGSNALMYIIMYSQTADDIVTMEQWDMYKIYR